METLILRRASDAGSSARAPSSSSQDTDDLKGSGDAYFNFDYGTGRIRGLYLQGNTAAQPIFRDLLEPYKDLGASTLSIADIGATHHIPFDEVGLPAFQWIRDYMEGDNKRAAHTNMDTYDHVLENDLKQSAAVAASLIYQLAMRDERIPRKSLPSR